MSLSRMSASIGKVLGGRYRLVSPIGMGASAQVFLADDARLRRRVAVKVLHDALAQDAEFLRRFRAEAQAAAALNHPHIMAVYDWGEEDVPFIVTEYLGGGSLRALLDTGETLSPAQALLVGIEAARALDFAHRRGFVHRDIKPANLLFGDEGRLRVADFGLARALAEAAWTEPQGAVLGTARYAAPEQARGENLTGKADVYSLALVIIEAVTGQVPLVADTTIGTLMARVERPLEVPPELGPLTRVLERAGRRDPDERIDARTLAGGLLSAAKSLSTPEPLPLAGALTVDGTAPSSEDEPTMLAPGVGAVAPVLGATSLAVPGTPAPSDVSDLTDDDLDLDPPSWVNQREPVPDTALDEGTDDEDDELAVWSALLADDAIDASHDEADEEPGDEPQATAVEDDLDDDDRGDEPGGDGFDDGEDDESGGGGAPVLVGVGAGAGLVDHLSDGDAGPAGHPSGATPAVDPAAFVDDDVDQTEAVGGAVRFGDTEEREDTDEPATTRLVAAAVPAVAPADGGGDNDDGRRHAAPKPKRRKWPWVVAIVAVLAIAGGAGGTAYAYANRPVRTATFSFPVPTLTGLSPAQAQSVAKMMGWDVKVVHGRQDGSKPGTIIATDPLPAAVQRAGEPLTVTVSDGNTLSAVPANLVGQTYEAAKASLAAVGLKSSVQSEQYDEEAPAGTVLKVADGTPAQLPKGSTVSLVVSKGPAPRTVPSNLIGQSPAAVTAQLASIQLGANVVNEAFSNTVPKGMVSGTVPRAGASVPRGTVVKLVVSKGPDTVAVPSVAGASSPKAAAAILQANGLVPGSVTGSAVGTLTTSPPPGTKVKRGSTVNLVYR